MSLIHSCELNDANPFDYLTELQKHAQELVKNPTVWMSWYYRATLQQQAGTIRGVSLAPAKSRLLPTWPKTIAFSPQGGVAQKMAEKRALAMQDHAGYLATARNSLKSSLRRFLHARFRP